jgi:hypothetical protein
MACILRHPTGRFRRGRPTVAAGDDHRKGDLAMPLSESSPAAICCQGGGIRPYRDRMGGPRLKLAGRCTHRRSAGLVLYANANNESMM